MPGQVSVHVLDEEGNTTERTAETLRGRPRLLVPGLHHSVDGRIHRVAASDRCLQNLRGCHLAVLDEFREAESVISHIFVMPHAASLMRAGG